MVKLILKYTARDLTQEFLWAAFFFLSKEAKKSLNFFGRGARKNVCRCIFQTLPVYSYVYKFSGRKPA